MVKTINIKKRLSQNKGGICFVDPIFRFWFLFTFGIKVTKIQKDYVIFAYIFKAIWARRGKKQKENHKTKVTKIPKAKRRKYGINQI